MITAGGRIFSENNPLSDICEAILKEENAGKRVIGIAMNPETYFNYENNSFCEGLKHVYHSPNSFLGFPGIDLFLTKNIPVGKIKIITNDELSEVNTN